MSVHANPLLYLNMGGEMLYVLRQRLKAQKIDPQKTTQVLDDVTAALLNPSILSTVFKRELTYNLSWFRTTLESVALSSIMKLDIDSMNKLFDLMMMMFKYQLTAATGPREIILITLNHTDSFREMVTLTNAHESITLVHRMIIDTYGELTYYDIWQARADCLKQLDGINVRVSILLKLGLQNEDTTFNILSDTYNEKYLERDTEVMGMKLQDNNCRECNIGSFKLFGERVTILGKNIYSPNYVRATKPKIVQKTHERIQKDKGMKAELGMLAKQLGNDDSTAVTRPFSLDLFTDDVEFVMKDEKCREDVDRNDKNEGIKIDRDHKAKLDNICADFDEDIVERKINLLELLDDAN